MEIAEIESIIDLAKTMAGFSIGTLILVLTMRCSHANVPKSLCYLNGVIVLVFHALAWWILPAVLSVP